MSDVCAAWRWSKQTASRRTMNCKATAARGCSIPWLCSVETVAVEIDRLWPERGGEDPDDCDPFGVVGRNPCICDPCLECPVRSSRSNSFSDCKGGEIRIPLCDSFRLSLLNTRLSPFGEAEGASEETCGEGVGKRDVVDCWNGCGGGRENCA